MLLAEWQECVLSYVIALCRLTCITSTSVLAEVVFSCSLLQYHNYCTALQRSKFLPRRSRGYLFVLHLAGSLT